MWGQFVGLSLVRRCDEGVVGGSVPNEEVCGGAICGSEPSKEVSGGAVCGPMLSKEVSSGGGINGDGFPAALVQMFYCFAEEHSWG